jgi:hypothetical protein
VGGLVSAVGGVTGSVGVVGVVGGGGVVGVSGAAAPPSSGGGAGMSSGLLGSVTVEFSSWTAGGLGAGSGCGVVVGG